MIFHLLLYATFSLRQTWFLNLTQRLLTYLIVFAKVYLHFHFLNIDILRIWKFIQILYFFFIKTSKSLMRFNVLFLRLSAAKCSSCILFSMKHAYLLTVKISLDCNRTRTLNHLVCKRILNHLAKLTCFILFVMTELYCQYFSVRCIWLYVLVISRTRFWVNPHSIVAWMSRNTLLETGVVSEV